jgi:hypothetical protein
MEERFITEQGKLADKLSKSHELLTLSDYKRLKDAKNSVIERYNDFKKKIAEFTKNNSYDVSAWSDCVQARIRQASFDLNQLEKELEEVIAKGGKKSSHLPYPAGETGIEVEFQNLMKKGVDKPSTSHELLSTNEEASGVYGKIPKKKTKITKKRLDDGKPGSEVGPGKGALEAGMRKIAREEVRKSTGGKTSRDNEKGYKTLDKHQFFEDSGEPLANAGTEKKNPKTTKASDDEQNYSEEKEEREEREEQESRRAPKKKETVRRGKTTGGKT